MISPWAPSKTRLAAPLSFLISSDGPIWRTNKRDWTDNGSALVARVEMLRREVAIKVPVRRRYPTRQPIGWVGRVISLLISTLISTVLR